MSPDRPTDRPTERPIRSAPTPGSLDSPDSRVGGALSRFACRVAVLLGGLAAASGAVAASCPIAAGHAAVASAEAAQAIVPLTALAPGQSTTTKILLVLEATNDLAQCSAAISEAHSAIAAAGDPGEACPPAPIVARASAKLAQAQETVSTVAAAIVQLSSPTFPPAQFLALQAQSIAEIEAAKAKLDMATAQLLAVVTPCPGDLDGSGTVDAADLGLLLAAWATSDPLADLDESGIVDAGDLGLLLASWDGCPG
ncbi:MAG TPA: hypothetical protein PKC43_09840 [Phycisphaerales bacterium]|nr:hypothetical protein [Phycisphaerales bacterium]HMP37735.1 hypothetical protein [Phycisphaerales bacterium]